MVFKQDWREHKLYSLTGPPTTPEVYVSDPSTSKTFNTKNDMLALRAVAKLVRYMFDWEDTPQGHPYWARVVQNITDLTIMKGRKGHPYKGLTVGERKALMSFLEYGGK